MRPLVAGRFSASALAIVLVTIGSCYDERPYNDLLDHQKGLTGSTGSTPGDDAGSASSGVSSGPSGTGDDSVGEGSSGGGDSSGGGALDLGDDVDPQAALPQIYEFTATPAKLDAAGPLLLDLKVSDGVVELELRRVDDGGSALAELSPSDLPLHLAVVSAADNGTHRYRAIARDAQGQETRAELEVVVDLPETGQEIWSWESGHLESEALGIIPHDGGAVIAGYIVEDGEPRPIVTRLSDTGKVLWEVTPVDGRGYACALAARPQGDLVVIGNSYKGGGFADQAMWMRRISVDGDIAKTWGDDGVTGERALAVTTDPLGQVVIAGDFQTSAMKPHHDLRIWAYTGNGASRWSESWTRPGATYDRDEQAYAALVLPSGDILVAGHTSRDLFELPPRKQALILRIDANGVIDDAPWIDDKPGHYSSEVHALTRSAKGDLFIAGQATVAPDAAPRATVWRIDGELETQLWSRSLGQADDAFAESVWLTANKDVLVGSTKDERFHVTIAKPVGEGLFVWQEKLDLAGGPDRLRDLSLDTYDYIYVAGQATIGASRHAYARRISP